MVIVTLKNLISIVKNGKYILGIYLFYIIHQCWN